METELTSINQPAGLSSARAGGSKGFIANFFFLLGLRVSLPLLFANARQLWLQPGRRRGV